MTETSSLPARGGLGLKPDHYRDVLDSGDDDLWVEVHPENYMVDGGPRLAWLAAIRHDRALSFHGVGASLGGTDPLDPDHLARLKSLIDRFEPDQVSEHAAWSARAGLYYSDLLPIPRTREALNNLVANIDAFQTAIGRSILLENPSNYLPFASELDEPDFLVEAARRAGCGLLLDVNNVFVSARNVGIDADAYIRAVPGDLVGEIHVAGHDGDPNLGEDFLVDSHGAAVAEPVWALLETALTRLGPRPVLVERDANLPAFDTLHAERVRADALVRASERPAYAAA